MHLRIGEKCSPRRAHVGGHFPFFCRVHFLFARERALGVIIRRRDMLPVISRAFQLLFSGKGNSFLFQEQHRSASSPRRLRWGYTDNGKKLRSPKRERTERTHIPSESDIQERPVTELSRYFRWNSGCATVYGRPTPPLRCAGRAPPDPQLRLVYMVPVCVPPTHSFFICYIPYNKDGEA